MTAIQQQTLDEAGVFVDLVLGDDDLVRAEFDALIADSWESPCEPSRRKPCPSAGGWAAWPPGRWPRWHRIPLAATVLTCRPEARGRDPPGRLA